MVNIKKSFCNYITLETVPKGFKRGLEKLETEDLTESIQITELLRSA